MHPIHKGQAWLTAASQVPDEVRVFDSRPTKGSGSHPIPVKEGIDFGDEGLGECHRSASYRKLTIRQEEISYSPKQCVPPRNATMDAVRKLIVDRVPNLKEMSLKIGMSHSYLQQFVKRGSPKALPEDVRERLALELDVSPDLLRSARQPNAPANIFDEKELPNESIIDVPVAPRKNVSPLPDIPGPNLTGDVDLPVYGIAQGGRGALILSNEAVDRVLRPAPLLRVKDGYGVIVIEDSMSPEFESGDIALVNPHLPPRGGDTCIFRHRGEDGTEMACIKRLRRVTENSWQVTEWNSDEGTRRDFSLKRSEWQFCHVTVGNYKRR